MNPRSGAAARGALCAGLVLLLLVSGSDVAAFTLERVNENPCDAGARNLSWESRAAGVDAGRVPAPFRVAVDTARGRWKESLPVFSFSSRGGGEFCDSEDGVVTMAFSPTSCDERPLGDALAITRLRWKIDSGSLVDADVVFTSDFAANPTVSIQEVFLEVALHELGHVLGLDHSDACGASGVGTLMRSRLFFNAPRLDRPQDDDINGARSIYPAGGGEPLPEGVNSCVVVAPRGVAWPVVIPAILICLRRFSLLTRHVP